MKEKITLIIISQTKKNINNVNEISELRLNFLGGRPINEEIYLILEEADIESGGEVAEFLNGSGKASLTCCPLCGVDDFIHVQGCKLDRFNK